MRELRMDKKRVQAALDRKADFIPSNPYLVQRVLNAANKEGEVVVKKKFSIGMILVTVMLLATVTALAATLIFANRVPATEAADQAMLDTYGITAQMQSMFNRRSTDGEDGTTVVTYEGMEDLAFILGKYTVIVDGKTVKSISWSRDGEDTSGGLEACAWGKEQLEEILKVDPETGKQAELRTFQPYIDRINQQYGFDYEAYCAENANDHFVVVLQGGEIEKAKEKQQLTNLEMIDLAKEAVTVRYHLTDEQATGFSVDVEDSSAYVLRDGTLCFRCWLFLGEFSEEETDQNGTYIVYINLETGVVEDTMFLHEQSGGNG